MVIGQLTSLTKKNRLFAFLLPIFLFILVILVQTGSATVIPDFYGINQANKTFFDQDNISTGDYLYLSDNSTITPGDGIAVFNWTVVGYGSQYTRFPVFGPLNSLGPLLVVENVTNSTGWNNQTVKTLFVVDNYSRITGDFTYKADYANRSSLYPNGTLTIQDNSDLQNSPPDTISGWWWRLWSKNGLVSGNWSGQDSITVNMSNDTYYMNVTVESETGYLISYNGTIAGNPDYHQPVANFTAVYRNGTSPQVVAFIDQSIGLTNLTYRWDFGDNNTSVDRNPEHVYVNRSMPYFVNLTVTDLFGISNSWNRTNYINVTSASLLADFVAAPQSGPTPLNVTFIDKSKNTLPIVSYDWDFGDGFKSTNSSPQHQYTSLGSWDVTLNVTDSAGNINSTKKNKYIVSQITPPPLASFSASPMSGRIPLTVSFIDLTIPASSSNLYAWDFGDGGYADTKNPVHVYTNSGSYVVNLNVTDRWGNWNRTSLNSIVVTNLTPADKPLGANFSAIPVGNTDPLSGDAPFEVHFIDLSTGDPSAWKWDFNDGSTSSEKSPVHWYMRPGTYSVTLDVYNETKENPSSFTKDVTIVKYNIQRTS